MRKVLTEEVIEELAAVLVGMEPVINLWLEFRVDMSSRCLSAQFGLYIWLHIPIV